MANLSPQPLPPREVAVTVHIPGNLLDNLETFQNVQASIFDRFGCPCNSGIEIAWKRYELELVVTPDFEIGPLALPGRG